MVTYDMIRQDGDLRTYVKMADESLAALGYTEHSFPHVMKVAEDAAYILRTLGYDDKTVELARIAGYMHDIGNLVNRVSHSQSGAIMAFRILDKMGMPADDISIVVTAIGNHDEGTGKPVSPVAAALILADKCDVRRSRVRNSDFSTFDIHDRVNWSVKRADVVVTTDDKRLTLSLEIEHEIGTVMDYFEIFLDRMIMCRKAAEALGLEFKLIIDGHALL